MRISKGRNFPHIRRLVPTTYAQASAPADQTGERRPLVLAGCFQGLPEQAYFGSLVASGTRLAYVESRGQLLLAATLLQPQGIVLPSNDARGVSTRSIVSRCLSLSPAPAKVLLLLSLAPGARRYASYCPGPGVDVAAVRTADELAEAVAELLRPDRPALQLLA